MNLYQVSDKDYDWICYVFDVSRNRAKAMVAESFGIDYVDMRCKTLRKGVNIQTPTMVDDEQDEAYKTVLECGYRYCSEEEMEAMIDGWFDEPFRKDE